MTSLRGSPQGDRSNRKYMNKTPCIYILANQSGSVLYIGVTNNLAKRVYEHKNKITPGFTTKYNVTKLVYFEVFETMPAAIEREKQIKGGSREKKLKLIDLSNPNHEDLYDKIV